MKNFSNYYQPLLEAVREKNGAFYAFSNDQFQEQKQEGIKYTVFKTSSLLCPTKNVEAYLNEFSEAMREAVHQDVNENGADEIIQRAYWNHETQITMNDTDARATLARYIEQFPEQFTEEKIKKLFSQCFQYAIANDLF